MIRPVYCRAWLRLVVLVWLACLSGCSGQDVPTSSFAPTQPIVVSTPTPSPTPSLRLAMPTYTLVPARSRTPTITPAPTLPADEEYALVLDLLQNNAGCRLPCWWGFTPGETTWQTALEFFLSLGKSPAAYQDSQGTVNYTVQFRVPEQIDREGYIQQHYVVRNNIIEMIVADPGESQNYTLPQLLAAYGQPTEVWVSTFSAVADQDNGELPFFLLLHYPQQGIWAEYIGFAHKSGDQIPLCPQYARVLLRLLEPNRKASFEDLTAVGELSLEEALRFRPFKEVTDWSIEQFYQTFIKPGSRVCPATPADLW